MKTPNEIRLLIDEAETDKEANKILEGWACTIVKEAVDALDIPEWIDVSGDNVEKKDYPNDFEPVLCFTENEEYQVLMLCHYTSNIIDSEWDTVGLKRNTSYPLPYVKKYQYISEPK